VFNIRLAGKLQLLNRLVGNLQMLYTESTQAIPRKIFFASLSLSRTLNSDPEFIAA
jgi:hypothetical protein